MGKFIYIIPLAFIGKSFATCIDLGGNTRAVGDLFIDPNNSNNGCECREDGSAPCTDFTDDSTGCPDIRFNIDFNWEQIGLNNIKTQFEFEQNCGTSGPASSGEKCRIKPKSDGDCHQGSKGSIFLRKNPDSEDAVIRTKSFVCRLDTQTNKYRWARRALTKSENKRNGLRTLTKVGFADEWKAECGEPETGCEHPKNIFNDQFVNLEGHSGHKANLPDTDNVNINDGRKAKWVCKDRNNKVVMTETIPRLSKCEMICSNTFVPKVGKKITCKDHRNTGAYANNKENDYAGIAALYRALHKGRYVNKQEFAKMAIDGDRAHGWKCYTTQPVYDDWTAFGECIDGKQTRTRTCEGSCDDTTETQDC